MINLQDHTRWIVYLPVSQPTILRRILPASPWKKVQTTLLRLEDSLCIQTRICIEVSCNGVANYSCNVLKDSETLLDVVFYWMCEHTLTLFIISSSSSTLCCERIQLMWYLEKWWFFMVMGSTAYYRSEDQEINWLYGLSLRDNVRAGFYGCFFWCVTYRVNLPGQLQRIRNFNSISLEVEWWDIENMLLFFNQMETSSGDSTLQLGGIIFRTLGRDKKETYLTPLSSYRKVLVTTFPV